MNILQAIHMPPPQVTHIQPKDTADIDMNKAARVYNGVAYRPQHSWQPKDKNQHQSQKQKQKLKQTQQQSKDTTCSTFVTVTNAALDD